MSLLLELLVPPYNLARYGCLGYSGHEKDSSSEHVLQVFPLYIPYPSGLQYPPHIRKQPSSFSSGFSQSWLEFLRINTLLPLLDMSMFKLVLTACEHLARASQVALLVKNPPANAGDKRYASSIPGSGRSPWRRTWQPLQYSCLENPTDRGAWRATVHGVAKSWTRLSN